MYRNNLRITDITGFAWSNGRCGHAYSEVPFEEVIFEEAVFSSRQRQCDTVKVRNHVASVFADTDVAVISRFVRKMGKEAGDVGLEQGLRYGCAAAGIDALRHTRSDPDVWL